MSNAKVKTNVARFALFGVSVRMNLAVALFGLLAAAPLAWGLSVTIAKVVLIFK